MPTLQMKKKSHHHKQTLQHNKHAGNVHVFCCVFFWSRLTVGGGTAAATLQLFFLKRTENILQHAADNVNFLSKLKNMQMKMCKRN